MSKDTYIGHGTQHAASVSGPILLLSRLAAIAIVFPNHLATKDLHLVSPSFHPSYPSNPTIVRIGLHTISTHCRSKLNSSLARTTFDAAPTLQFRPSPVGDPSYLAVAIVESMDDLGSSLSLQARAPTGMVRPATWTFSKQWPLGLHTGVGREDSACTVSIVDFRFM